MPTMNQLDALCRDCGAAVPAGQGVLYRHHGANLGSGTRRLKIRRGARYAYVVRCQRCAEARGDVNPHTPSAPDGAPRQYGYSEACGIWN